MKLLNKIIRAKWFYVLIAIIIFFYFLQRDASPVPNPELGVSFSKFHSDELGLDWKKVYQATLTDLHIKNFRFSAHWPMVEPSDGKFNFNELDYQVKEAQKNNASVIIAVGRRLPGWPECHSPDWVTKLSQADQQQRVLRLIETTVNRYKGYTNIRYWQVENEPFLSYFSHITCGDLDEVFLEKEIALVRQLDPNRKILVTDSGEFGSWAGAYQAGDVFGTSQYLYIWFKNWDLPFRYPIGPWFFHIKENLIRTFYGDKPIIAIEVSSEPWLPQPIVETPMRVLLERMGPDKFQEMIDLSHESGFDDIYYWGVEWWYWMRENGHPEFWSIAKALFAK